MSQHQWRLGKKPSIAIGKRIWPAQAPGELSQCQLKMGMASTEQALESMEQHSREHGAAFQEGMEQVPGREQAPGGTVRCRGGEGGVEHLPSALEIPPWHGEAVPTRPRWHRVRGSHRRYVDEAPAHQAQTTPWTRPSNSGASSRSPWPRSQASEGRGCEQRGSNRVDLADRRNRRRLIYRLGGISAAETDGARRNRARRRRGDTVARGSRERRGRE
jgi:hypothetical protein